MKEVGDGRSLLDPQYPIVLVRHACHPPRHRRRSSRRRSGRRPVDVMPLATSVARAADGGSWRWLLMLIGGVCAVGRCGYRGGELGSDEPQGRYPWRRHCRCISTTCPQPWRWYMLLTYMSRQVFPQAPSPTMTNLRRISAICATVNGPFPGDMNAPGRG